RRPAAGGRVWGREPPPGASRHRPIRAAVERRSLAAADRAPAAGALVGGGPARRCREPATQLGCHLRGLPRLPAPRAAAGTADGDAVSQVQRGVRGRLGRSVLAHFTTSISTCDGYRTVRYTRWVRAR